MGDAWIFITTHYFSTAELGFRYFSLIAVYYYQSLFFLNCKYFIFSFHLDIFVGVIRISL